MKTKEFIKKVTNMGYQVDNADGYMDVRRNGVTIAKISQFNNNVLLTAYWDSSLEEELFDAVVEYARTPIKERKGPEKYCWKLKGNWGNDYIYLNCDTENNAYEIDSSVSNDCFETQFTEDEFEEICDEYCLVKEAFEKERIQK